MDKTALEAALEKIRGEHGNDEGLLSQEESAALADYLNARAGDPGLPEADQILCARIRQVLQKRAAPTHAAGESEAYQRTNLNLRAAMDIFLHHEYAAVRERDLALLRKTSAKLQVMAGAEPVSPNQDRLARLIADCLEAYAAWSAGSDPKLAPAQGALARPAASAAERSGVLDTHTFLEGASPREPITALEGVPLSINVRRIAYPGALVLKGDLPDEFLLESSGGPLTLHGPHFGFIVADGDVTIDGNVHGGWIYSRNGSISAAHILAGSTLIAPRGDILLGTAENPRMACCGGDCRVEDGVLAGTYHVRNFEAGGEIRNAALFVRGLVKATTLTCDSDGKAAGIHFRMAQTCEDFGRPIPASAHTGLRSFGRCHYRLRATSAVAAFFDSELLNMQRARLFAVQAGGMGEPSLTSVRSAHAEMATLGLLLEIGEGLKELLAMGENLGHEFDSALTNIGVEESGGHLALVAREIKGMGREYIRDRECFEAPCRHIASFAKKLKDAVRTGRGLEKLLFDFDYRMDEWRVHYQQAAAEDEQNNTAMARVLGPSVWPVTAPDRLGALLTRMVQAAEGGGKLPSIMQSREMAALRERAEQYTAHCAQAVATADALRREYEQALKALEETIGLALADHGACGVIAGYLPPGLHLQTLASAKRSSGGSGAYLLTTGHEKTTGTVHVRNLRLYPEAAPS